MNLLNRFFKSCLKENASISSVCIKTIAEDIDRKLVNDYYHFLPHAFKIAVDSIHKYITEKGFEHPTFSWIQTQLLNISFQHLCFRYGTQVYSVLIAISGIIGEDEDNDCAILRKQDYDNLISESNKFNLIPCIFPIDLKKKSAQIGGIHLLHAIDNTAISMDKNDMSELVPMSKWEINNMGIDIVAQHLSGKGFKIFSYCDVVDIEPQLWFYDNSGRRCFVYVNSISGNYPESAKYRLNINSLKRFKTEYNESVGYYAKLSFFPADAVAYDKEGAVVPLSKRDNLSNPVEILYRGKGFYVNFSGLQELQQAIKDDDSLITFEADYYNVR